MSATSEVPLGYVVAEFNQASMLPERLTSDDLFGDAEEARLEAKTFTEECALSGRREAYQVCAVVPLDEVDGGL